MSTKFKKRQLPDVTVYTDAVNTFTEKVLIPEIIPTQDAEAINLGFFNEKKEEIDNEIILLKNPDRIVVDAGFTLTGQVLTMNALWQWVIDNTSYSNPTSLNLTIPLSSATKTRADIVVLTKSNNFVRVEGVESSTNPPVPNIPNDTLLALTVIVNDSAFVDIGNVITGDAFVKKSERANVLLTGSGVVDNLSLTDEKATIVFKGSITELRTMSYSSVPYNGKRITLFNAQNTPVLIKNAYSGLGVDFVFPDGLDYTLKPKETIEFSFDITYLPYAHHMFIGVVAKVDQTIIDGSTNAVSGNAVFDGLVGKQPLENQRLSTTNNVAFNSVIATNSATIASLAVGTNSLQSSADIVVRDISSGTYGRATQSTLKNLVGIGGDFVSTISLLLFQGDSMTVGVLEATPYPNLVSTINSFAKTNNAVGGKTVQTIKSEANTLDDVLYRFGSRQNIYILWAGTNDLYNFYNVQDTFDNLVATCKERQKKGFKVIVLTTLDRCANAVNGTDMTILINQYNALIRESWQSFADDMVDVANNSTFLSVDPCTDNVYFNGDGIHLTTAGNTIIANLVSESINKLSSQKTFQDVDIKGKIVNPIKISSNFGTTLPAQIIYNPQRIIDNAGILAFEASSDGFGDNKRVGSIEFISNGFVNGQTVMKLNVAERGGLTNTLLSIDGVSKNSTFLGNLLVNEKIGIGTSNITGAFSVKTGNTVTANFTGQDSGSISIANIGSETPTISGKSTNSTGLNLISLSPNTNGNDMLFDVRENDNTDFSTLTSAAFRFRRFGTVLMDILRNGDVTLLGSATATAWKVTGGLVSQYQTGTGTVVDFGTSVRGSLLTGYVSGAGTVAATDNVLQAINKLNGNNALKANLASPTFTGSVVVPNAVNANEAVNKGQLDAVASSGTYTPNLVGVTNVTSISIPASGIATFTKIGNIVNVMASVSVTPTTASSSVNFTISLPVNRSSSALKFIGLGSCLNLSSGSNVEISSNSTNTATVLFLISASASARIVTLSFQYDITQ